VALQPLLLCLRKVYQSDNADEVEGVSSAGTEGEDEEMIFHKNDLIKI
jgi:hypothetical protein